MAAKRVPGVLASFIHIDAACDAIGLLRAGGRSDFTVYSAAPNHELEEALGIHNSPVRLFTLFGGLTGCTAGFAMTIWMSRDWPLLVGGKPIAAIAPYVVIGFELTILLGALSTVAGIILLSLRNPTTGLAYDPAFSDDRIGIFVPAGADQAGKVRELLERAGAAEVRHDA
jgi:molybdopterin-containing oxidoreductase family membrane subunit